MNWKYSRRGVENQTNSSMDVFFLRPLMRTNCTITLTFGTCYYFTTNFTSNEFQSLLHWRHYGLLKNAFQNDNSTFWIQTQIKLLMFLFLFLTTCTLRVTLLKRLTLPHPQPSPRSMFKTGSLISIFKMMTCIKLQTKGSKSKVVRSLLNIHCTFWKNWLIFLSPW